MSIIEDFAPYKDEYGLIHPEIGKISGNGIRYTCEYWFALEKPYHTVSENIDILTSLRICEPKPGLLYRHPTNKLEQEGPDDYVARIAVCTSWPIDCFAKRFLEYGRANGFIYDNNPFLTKISPLFADTGAYLGRQQQIICHAMWAAGEEPDLILKAWWVLALMQSAFSKKQDSKILGWYLVKVAKGRSSAIDLFILFWRWKFKKHYPGGVGEVLKNYFGSDEHPSVKWLWNEFGE